MCARTRSSCSASSPTSSANGSGCCRPCRASAPRSRCRCSARSSPRDLASAIAMRDKATVARTPGVGAKVAERIVTELKDKAPAYADLDPAVVRLSGAVDEKRAPQPVADAVSALVNLGYGQPQAAAAIAAARAQRGRGRRDRATDPARAEGAGEVSAASRAQAGSGAASASLPCSPCSGRSSVAACLHARCRWSAGVPFLQLMLLDGRSRAAAAVAVDRRRSLLVMFSLVARCRRRSSRGIVSRSRAVYFAAIRLELRSQRAALVALGIVAVGCLRVDRSGISALLVPSVQGARPGSGAVGRSAVARRCRADSLCWLATRELHRTPS